MSHHASPHVLLAVFQQPQWVRSEPSDEESEYQAGPTYRQASPEQSGLQCQQRNGKAYMSHAVMCYISLAATLLKIFCQKKAKVMTPRNRQPPGPLCESSDDDELEYHTDPARRQATPGSEQSCSEVQPVKGNSWANRSSRVKVLPFNF